MKNYKSILCLLLSLVLIFSVVFPLGASAVEEPGAGSGGSKGVTVNFICGDKTFDPVMIYVDADKTEITPADLADAIPAGYGLANDQTYVLKFDNPIYVELVDTKSIWVDYVDEGGNPVFTTNMTVPYVATTVNSADLVGIPTGYELAVAGELTIVNGHVEVVVKQIPYDKYIDVSYVLADGTVVDVERYYTKTNVSQFDPKDLKNVPEGYAIVNMNKINILPGTVELKVQVERTTRTLLVNYVTANGGVVSRERVTIAKNATQLLMTSLKRVPEGYAVVNQNPINILPTSKNVDVLVESTSRVIVISYVNQYGTVVGTEDVRVEKSMNQFDPAVLTNVPEGYAIVNMNPVNIVPSTNELKVLVDRTTRTLVVKYVTESGREIATERVTIAKNATQLLMGSLKRVPEGYAVVNQNPINILPTSKSVDVLVESTSRVIVISYVNQYGTVVGTEDVRVEKSMNQFDPAVLTNVPEGYAIVNMNPVNIVPSTNELKVLVDRTTRTLVVKYVTESGREIATERVTIAKDATQLLMGSLKRVPEGYAVVNQNPINILSTTKSVDVLVESTSRVIVISYVNQYGTVVGTEDVRVEKSMNQFDPAVLTNAPEGYAIVNMNPVNIVPSTNELKVLVDRTTRTLVVKYVTESGREIATERVTIAKNATQLLMGSLKRVPEGYAVVNQNPINILSTTKSVDVLVESTSRVIVISYVNQYGTVVGTEDVRVEKSMNQFDPAVLTNVPEGYAIVNMNPVNIVPSTNELKVLVDRTTRTLVVKYVTESGREIATERVTIAKDATQLLMGSLKRVPEGYAVVNQNPINILSTTKSVEVLVVAKEREILVNYVTEDGALVLTSSMVVKENQDCVNTSLLTDVPYGYEIVATGDMPIKGNHIDVVVREKAYTKTVLVNYVTEDGALVLTSDILMDKDATHVNTSLLTDVPYGYEVAVTGDMPIEDNSVNVVVRAKEYTKSVLVNYVNEADNKCVLTSSIVVYMDATCVNTSLLTDVPYGYEIAVTGDMPIKGNHIDVFVREKTYTKTVLVNYVTEDGALVLTSDILMDKDATCVNTSLLTDVPYGYEIAVTGDMPIEGNHIDVVVRSTYVPEPTVPETTEPEETKPEETKPEETKPEETKPEETKPEETKPEETEPEETKPEETKPEETKPEETKPEETKPEETKPAEVKPTATEGKTPNTGDASGIMTWILLLTVSGVCAACVFFRGKKTN